MNVVGIVKGGICIDRGPAERLTWLKVDFPKSA